MATNNFRLLSWPVPAVVMLIAAFALYLPTAHAADYYVSPAGTDGASGENGQPWKTLQYAANHVQPGDVVHVLPGDYTGFVMGWDGPQNGTADRPIVFKAQPGARIVQRNAKTADGINLEGASYIVIDGFEINAMPRAGIRSVTNSHVTIRNNKCDSNGRWGIFTGFSDDLLIENNITSRSVAEHGIYVSNSALRPIVRKNVSWGNYGCGIHMNGDASMGGSGIISGALVEQNYIYDNGRGGGSGINGDGVQNSVIQNNLLVRNHASGISLYQIDGAEGPANDLVINNTVVQPSDGRWALNLSSAAGAVQVYNNIFYNYHSFRGSITVDDVTLSKLVSDYNVLMNRFSVDTGDTVLTFSAWQQRSGQDSHSILSTPSTLFVDATANYELSANSPALDAGHALLAPLADFAGLPRLSGNGVDIGCYERQSNVPTPTPLPGTPTPTAAPTSSATPAPTPRVDPTPTRVATITPIATSTPRKGRPKIRLVTPKNLNTIDRRTVTVKIEVEADGAPAVSVRCQMGSSVRTTSKAPYLLKLALDVKKRGWQKVRCTAAGVDGSTSDPVGAKVRYKRNFKLVSSLVSVPRF